MWGFATFLFNNFDLFVVILRFRILDGQNKHCEGITLGNSDGDFSLFSEFFQRVIHNENNHYLQSYVKLLKSKQATAVACKMLFTHEDISNSNLII